MTQIDLGGAAIADLPSFGQEWRGRQQPEGIRRWRSRMDYALGKESRILIEERVLSALAILRETVPELAPSSPDLVSPAVVTVLERSGLLDAPSGVPFRELSGLPQLAQALQRIPAGLGYELLGRLESVALECTAQPGRPPCARCPLALLCDGARASKLRQARDSKALVLVDLFCGAGGLSEGFRQAGFRSVLAVDADEAAIQTYRLNHPEVEPDRIICRDLRGFADEATTIRELLGGLDVDVLAGGPPCQGYSRAGMRAKVGKGAPPASQDERNHLFREMVAMLEGVRPRAFVMENVPGIAEVKFDDGRSFADVIVAAFESCGYSVASWLLDAASYGAPQHRMRRIIVGFRDVPAPPCPPPATHRALGRSYVSDTRTDDLSLPPALTVSEAIGDLPELAMGEGRNLMAFGGTWLQGHRARYNNPADLERYAALMPGEVYRDLVVRRPDLQNYRVDAFPDKYARLDGSRPSRTVVAHLARDGNSFVHPTQVRSITMREAARLQSFPDSYVFWGSHGKTMRQIGNAVPCSLAKAIALHVRSHLDVAPEAFG